MELSLNFWIGALIVVCLLLAVSAIVNFIAKKKYQKKADNSGLFINQFSESAYGQEVDFSNINWYMLGIGNSNELTYYIQYISLVNMIKKMMYLIQSNNESQNLNNLVDTIRKKIKELHNIVYCINHSSNLPLIKSDKKELLVELDDIVYQRHVQECRNELIVITCSRVLVTKDAEKTIKLMVKFGISLEELNLPSESLYLDYIKDTLEKQSEVSKFAEDIAANSTKKKNNEEQK